MTKNLLVVCVLGAFAVAACGGSKDADLANAGQQAAASVEQAMKDAAAGKTSNVKVVPHEQLLPFLPQIGGWTREEPTGETDSAMGVNVSRVRTNYEKGESRMSFEIMDSSMNQAMTVGFQMASKLGVEERRSDGYTKATKVAGFPAVEEWTPEARNGEISLLVAGRFLVRVGGDRVPDVDTMRKAAEAIDLNKLAALK